MAALMRSVLRYSRLNVVQVSGNIQPRRDVRALKRRPVRVIPPDVEPKLIKNVAQEWGPLSQQNDKGQPQQNDKGQPQQNDKRQPQQNDKRQPQQNDKRQPQQNDKRQPQQWGSLTQQKDTRQPQDWGFLTQKKDKKQPHELVPHKEHKDKRHSHKQGALTQHQDMRQSEEQGHLPQNKDKRQPQDERRYQSVTINKSQMKDGADEQNEPETAQLLELKYEKIRPGDNRLGKVVSIAKSKGFRDRHGQILLEGRRLLLDALETGAILHTLFFTRVDQLKRLPYDKLLNVNLVKVKFEAIDMWSDVVSPQGLMGIFRKPDWVKMAYPETQLKNTLPLSLICDNIRDPGNLGTILRSAAGAGCNKVLLTKGCVDAWEPKVIRAGMGAHFRLPIITGLDWDSISHNLPENTKVFVADNTCKNFAEESEVMSNKAADYGWICSDPRKLQYIEGEEDYYSSGDEGDEELQDIPKISTQSYHEQWARAPSALVIGGETQGLSLESIILAENSGGRRLYIPLVPGIDSLNSAMAASILLFEGSRQLQMKSSLPNSQAVKQ